jgi:putative transposase
MIYLLLAHLVSLLLDLFAILLRSQHHKDLEILLLRQQLRILQRQHPRAPRVPRCDKLALAVLAAKFASLEHGGRDRLNQIVLLFKPDTLLRWHRDLVQRKWTFTKRRTGGRPATDPDLTALLLRLAQENLSWGYNKIQGGVLKLGYTVGRSTIRDILKCHQVPPAPQRAKQGSSWRTFLRHYRQQMLACDFFTVETAWLKTIYVFFFIELGSRRVHFAGCTSHPTAAWVTQQARQLTWTLQDEKMPIRFLIRDRDAKFTESFDTVFVDEGVEIIRTPYRAPRANAFPSPSGGFGV